MGRAQELFDQATGYYDHAVGLIRKMDELFQNAAFKNDPGRRYDPRLTLAQFDMILQASLLSVAVSDGRFDPLEQQFVDKITDYGDLLTYIKQDSQGRLDLTWSQVASLREETQASLVQALPAILDKLCDSFVRPLALVDQAVLRAQGLKQIIQDVARICACLSQVDGVNQERERAACIQMVNELLGKRWERYMS